MCTITRTGSKVTATWTEPIANVAPVTFHPDDRMGQMCCMPVASSELGASASSLVDAWRNQVPEGTLAVRTSKIWVFDYPTMQAAEKHQASLAALIHQHTRDEAHSAVG